jgi:hypothetical protein
MPERRCRTNTNVLGFDRIAQEIMRLGRGQQALFALVDALTKTVLTHTGMARLRATLG